MSLPPPTKIICVGRNYAAHAKELGNVVPERPLLFFKPPSAIIGSGEAIQLPPESERPEYEAEIAVVVGRRAHRVTEEAAWDHLAAVAPLNDVTARDLQKTDGQWARAKGFDTFCPLGEPVPIDRIDRDDLRITARLNGETVQEGHVREMVFSIPFLVAYISRIMTLEPGDLIATGTPAGVGPLVPGDVIEIEIPGAGRISNPVRAT